MTYIPYHSGSPPEALEFPEFRDAPRALTPFGIRPRAIPPFFTVHYWTHAFRPGHQVTVRSAVDGWARDIYGSYRDGAWRFEFSHSQYPGGLEMKFVLDGTTWMDGYNLHLAAHDHHFDDSGVTFPGAAPRYQHGYDNLRTGESRLGQFELRHNLDPAPLYDVVIIGSGFGGGILADALSDMGVSTLVLEAGTLVFPSHITNLPGDWPALPARHQVGHFINLPGSKFLGGVHMSLGGRSVYWSGLIPRMHGWELGHWPRPVADYLTGSGYDRAETVLRKQRVFGRFQADTIGKLRTAFPDFVVEDLPRSRHQPDPGPEDPLLNVLEKSTGTFSTADLLLDSMAYGGLAGRDNLTINTNHLVTAIETSGPHATAVVAQDLVGGLERRYRGRAVVLAAGSLESARIALRSGLTNPSGRIGRGLTDHPAFFSQEYVIPPGTEFGGIEDHAKILLHHSHAAASNHPFNVELLVNPRYWEVRHPDDDLRKQRLSQPAASSVRMQFIFGSPLDDGNFIQDSGPGSRANVFVAPNLSGSQYWNEVRDLRNALCSFLNVPSVPFDDYMHFGNEGTVHHAGGTLRMSGNHTGVVDDELRFEGYDNLFACDVSVFPFIPAANPALTLSALAIRLADHLAALVP